MRATQAVSKSVTMAVAMSKPAYQKPAQDVIMLESPNTMQQRKARENFYNVIGRGQGLHVKF